MRAAMPGGFRAGGLAAGIKPSGRPDLAVVATTRGSAAAAAVFTTNQVVAAPIRLSRAHLNATEVSGGGRFGWTDAVVATAGSANAATGIDGENDQAEVGKVLAALLATEPERTLAVSTGVIGVRLPMSKVREGLDRLIPQCRRGGLIDGSQFAFLLGPKVRIGRQFRWKGTTNVMKQSTYVRVRYSRNRAFAFR